MHTHVGVPHRQLAQGHRSFLTTVLQTPRSFQISNPTPPHLLGTRPPTPTLQASKLLSLTRRVLPSADGQALSTLLMALLQMRVRPTAGWMRQMLGGFARQLPTPACTPEAVARVLYCASQLRWRLPPALLQQVREGAPVVGRGGVGGFRDGIRCVRCCSRCMRRLGGREGKGWGGVHFRCIGAHGILYQEIVNLGKSFRASCVSTGVRVVAQSRSSCTTFEAETYCLVVAGWHIDPERRKSRTPPIPLCIVVEPALTPAPDPALCLLPRVQMWSKLRSEAHRCAAPDVAFAALAVKRLFPQLGPGAAGEQQQQQAGKEQEQEEDGAGEGEQAAAAEGSRARALPPQPPPPPREVLVALRDAWEAAGPAGQLGVVFAIRAEVTEFFEAALGGEGEQGAEGQEQVQVQHA